MKKLLLLALCLWPSLALAQNPQCPTRSPGDNTNACASTAFVQNAISSVPLVVGSTPITGGTGGRILYDNSGALGERTVSGTGIIIATTTGALTSGHCVNIDASGNLVDAGSACSSGSGITQLTGDVTAGPGSGSVAATIAANAVTNAKLAAMTQNAVKGAASSTAVADLSVPSCSAATSALTWTTNTGFGCNTVSASGTLVSIVVYSGSQTITIPATATKAFIRMWGGSGGSGGAGTNGSGSAAASAGGGAGAYLEKYLTGLTPGNTVAYTQGAAGAAGSATPGNGGNGTASSLASGSQTITTLTANGGSGSAAVTSTSTQRTFAGGVGGTATNGDYNLPGAAGGMSYTQGDGSTLSIISIGSGGASLYSPGANGVGPLAGSAGNAGVAGGLIIMWFTWNLAPANDNFAFAQVA
jgi:hypothetical protein